MDFLHRPNRLLVTGRSGTGKTEYFIRYVRAVSARYSRVCVYDHECEFSLRNGLAPCRTLEELAELRPVECFDYADLYPGERETGFEFYCDWLFQNSQASDQSVLLCCDEVQKILGTDILPPDVACVIETGRRYRMDTLLVSQQPNLLHNRFRNQFTEVCTFRQNDARAIDWLEDWGFDPDGIRDLDSGDFICLTDQGVAKSGNIFRGASAVRRVNPQRVVDGQDGDPAEEQAPSAVSPDGA